MLAPVVTISASVIESVPTDTTISLSTITGVYSSPEMLTMSVKFKPWIVSLPSPSAYAITFSLASLDKMIESLPAFPAIVTNEEKLEIVSLSAPPEIEAINPLFVIESLPPFASIVTP